MTKIVGKLEEVFDQAAKDYARRWFQSLSNKVASDKVLTKVWLQVWKNDGRGGVDGKEFRDYEDPELLEKLLE